MGDDLTPEILGERLRRARTEAGLSQEEVARLVGRPRAAISLIEAGKQGLDSLLLRRLARLYGKSIDFFLGGEEPERGERHLVMLRLEAASIRRSPRIREHLSQFLEFCESYARLLDLLGVTLEVTIPKLPPLTSHSKRYAVRGEARQLRTQLGFDVAPIGPAIFDLLEDQGIGVFRLPLGEDGLSGAFVRHPRAGFAILVNGDDYFYRQVFTAAHEYGHALLHQTSQQAVCSLLESRESTGVDLSMEVMANEFASEFLMPEDGILGYLVTLGASEGQIGPVEVVRLQRHFGVSYRAMAYRLRRLNIMRNEETLQRILEEKPVHLASTLELPVETWEFEGRRPLTLGERFPRKYVALVLEAYHRQKITLGAAVQFLDTSKAELEELLDRFEKDWQRDEQDWESKTIR